MEQCSGSLHFELEEEDPQDVTTFKRLDAKVTPIRERVSDTYSDMRAIPNADTIDYVTRDFALSGFMKYDFLAGLKQNVLELQNDFSLNKKIGDHFWNVVLRAPLKNILICNLAQRTEFFVKKISEENYSYLIPEIGVMRTEDVEHSYRLAKTLEEVINVTKLDVRDPFQQRALEDLQLNLIELKKALYNIINNENVKQAKAGRTRITMEL
jgi:hypothetical protein